MGREGSRHPGCCADRWARARSAKLCQNEPAPSGAPAPSPASGTLEPLRLISRYVLGAALSPCRLSFLSWHSSYSSAWGLRAR